MPNRLTRPARNRLSWVLLLGAILLGAHLFQQYLRLSTDRMVAKQEAEVLENLVAHSEFAVMATDVHGTVTLWNQAATKLFGYTPEEMLGKSMLVILPKELQDVHKRNFARLAQDRHPKYSYRLVRCYAYAKTGELRDITLAIRAIPDNGTYKILVAVESPQLHEDPVVRKNLTEHQKLLDYISPTKGAQE